MDKCQFTENNATRDGGAIYWTGANGTVNDCQFTNNNATESGGAIYWTGANGTVNDCQFTGNNATSNGGAIYMTRVNNANVAVNNCNFSDNYAGSTPVLAAYGSNSNLIVDNCNIFNNTSPRYGFAVISVGNVTLSNCNIVNNTGIVYGGVCRLDGNVTVNNCNFTNNTYGYLGAIRFMNTENTLVNNCNFINNTGTDCTGISYEITKNNYIKNTLFKDNKALSNNITEMNNKTNLTLSFYGYQNYINAIRIYEPINATTINFENVTYWNGELVNSNNESPILSYQEAGQNITLEIYDKNNKLVDTYSSLTDSNGQITYNYDKLDSGNYTYKAYHPDNTYYTYIETEGSFSINKYHITVLDNKTKSGLKNRETTINATITDSNGQIIQPSADTKLVFTHPI